MKLGVLASGEGTTLQALIDAFTDKSDVMISVVLSNNSGAGSLRRAKASNIPAFHLSNRTHPSPEELDRAICSALQAHHVDLVILAGYMKRLGARTLAAFENRIVNTHPSLLPRFAGQGMFGLNVHRAVLNAHEVITGASVHLVTQEYDAGPIIGQRKVHVDPVDTPESLAERVQSCERELLVEIVTGILQGRIKKSPNKMNILLDTGSDVSFVSAAAAKKYANINYPLSMQLRKQSSVSGVGGKADGLLIAENVEVGLGSLSHNFNAMYAMNFADTSEALELEINLLLGRDFLDGYTLLIDYRNRQITFLR